ncbi:uncharacterized, partial [Tachysurus ichikawai]
VVYPHVYAPQQCETTLTCTLHSSAKPPSRVRSTAVLVVYPHVYAPQQC